jgi:hypothetical protein
MPEQGMGFFQKKVKYFVGWDRMLGASCDGCARYSWYSVGKARTGTRNLRAVMIWIDCTINTTCKVHP